MSKKKRRIGSVEVMKERERREISVDKEIRISKMKIDIVIDERIEKDDREGGMKERVRIIRRNEKKKMKEGLGFKNEIGIVKIEENGRGIDERLLELMKLNEIKIEKVEIGKEGINEKKNGRKVMDLSEE